MPSAFASPASSEGGSRASSVRSESFHQDSWRMSDVDGGSELYSERSWPHGSPPPTPGLPPFGGANDADPALNLQTPPQPMRSTKGFFNALKRGLRAKPPTVQLGPFVTLNEVPPTPARAPLDVANSLRTPKPGARAPVALAPKIRSTADTYAGGVPQHAPDVGQALRERAAAEAAIVDLFSAADRVPPQVSNRLHHLLARAQAQQAPEALAARLGQLAGEQGARPIHTMSVAWALAEVTGGDATRALAALDALGDMGGADEVPGEVPREVPREVKADVFALQRNLARTSLGFEALQALAPDLLPADDEPLEALTRREAAMHALRAADAVMAQLPAGEPAPVDLEEVLHWAQAMLPSELRTTGYEAPSSRGMPVGKGDLLAAKALVCANQLQADPHAMPSLALRSAYLAWRNGYTSEGKGSDLEKTQSRLFKLTTYAERATGTGSKSFLQRMFGYGKSPLSALPLGTVGARLRNPEDDFKTLNVVDVMVAHLNAQIGRRMQIEGGSRDALRMVVPKAVRVAAACRYKESMGLKGWRDEVKVGSTMRRQIAQDAAQALGVDVDTIRNDPAFKALHKLNASTLKAWAEEERLDAGPDSELGQQLDRLQQLQRNGDHFPKEATPDQVLDVLRDVAAHARSTFDVRYSDGGIHGINGTVSSLVNKAAAAASLASVPAALAGPDVKLLRGRQAMVNVGSSSHGGTLFVGTDTRSAVHAGVAAAAAWSVAGGAVSATAGLQVLPFMQERSAPKGVMIRTRMQNLGPAVPTGNPGGVDNEPWRGKLLEVFDAVARSGPEGRMPRHKEQMWDALADKFFKDPDVSINWMQTQITNTSSAATVSAGARGSFQGGYKAGLVGSAGAWRSWSNKMNREDTAGATKVQTVAHSSAHGVALSAGLVFGAKPLGDFSRTPGHVGSVVLPNAPLVGASVSLLTSSTGVVLRMAEDGGRILPDVTFRDIEFGKVSDYLKYVDSRNDAWSNSAAVDGVGGQEALNKYMTEVKGNADRGNAIFAERQRMTPEAARVIDELREARTRLSPQGRPPNADEQARIDGLNANIAAVMNDETSWRNRFLFVMEANTRQRTTGLGYLVQAQTQTDVSHLRMTAALKAND